MNNKKLLACSMFIAAASTAHAAVVDYESLQDLFGEPVTLSATGKPQRASEAPASMEIIDAETIRRSGAEDITDILRRATSVDVKKNFKGNADVSIRGMNQAYSNRLLVLVNGRQVYQDHYGVTYWDMLPVQLSEIQQIEIVRGPNTALFGFNAASGVINIVTYSPTLKDLDQVNVRVGTQAYGEANGVLTHKLSENTTARISAGYKQSNDYSRSSLNGYVDHEDTLQVKNVSVDVETLFANGGVLRTEFTHGYGKTDVTTPAGAANSIRHAYSAKADYRKDTDFGLVSLSAYYNAFNEDLDFGKMNNTLPAMEADNDLIVLKGELLKKVNSDHTLRFATEYRHNNLNATLTDEDELDNIYYDVYSLSTMWDWQVTPKLSWTNSVRYDHLKLGRDDEIDPAITASTIAAGLNKESYSRQLDEVSFNSGLLYKVTESDTVKASVARGLRIPALLQFGNTARYPVGAGGLAFISNPQLDLEVNLTYEVGYERKLNAIKGKAGVNLFHQHIYDVIGGAIIPASASTLIGGVPHQVLGEYNLGDVESVGLEFYMDSKPTENFSYGMNYTVNYFTEESDSRTAALQPMDTASQNNRHQATLWGRYTMDKLELDTALHYASKTIYRGTPDVEVDDYFVLNTRVGYNLTDATSVALEGINLLEEHNERPVVGGLGNSGNELGRSVFLSVKHKF